jgi:hypothetical protein
MISGIRGGQFEEEEEGRGGERKGEEGRGEEGDFGKLIGQRIRNINAHTRAGRLF